MKASNSALGILGGTFDPIHNGHLNPAIYAANHLGLTQVLLIPAHVPPHKKNTIANVKQRVSMVKLACRDQSLFTLDSRELNRNTPSYSVETLQEIKAEHANYSLYLFIGMDSLLTFTTWFHYQEILTLCHLIVTHRPGYELTSANLATQNLLKTHQVDTAEQLQLKKQGHIYIVQNNTVEISSTELRQKFKHGITCKNLLPQAVLQFIHAHQLYLK